MASDERISALDDTAAQSPEPGVAMAVGDPGAAPPAPAGIRGGTAVDRRSLFRLAAGAAGLTAAGVVLGACDMVDESTDPRVQVLRRATFGISTASLAHIRQLGTGAWLDEQLDPARLNTTALDATLAAFPLLSASRAEVFAAAATTDVGVQLRAAAMVRAIESPAQLFERMVEFWSDHLNVPVTDRRSGALKIIEDREVIRPHALGRFADLLVASAKSPAMLNYLDNGSSRRGSPNENYARELLELHTVGVGNHTEDDVAATARLLTGWVIDGSTGGSRFAFSRHDPAVVTAVGWTRPAAGTATTSEAHVDAFLVHLARHPATARRIATKLALRFGGDVPAPGLVDDLTAAYLANDTAIAPVLPALFSHPEFLAARGTKFRRPLDWFAAACRAVGATIDPGAETAPGILRHVVTTLGQTPFGWPAPNGFPDVEGAWLTSAALLGRWVIAADLMAIRNTPVAIPHDDLQAGLVGLSATAAVERLAERVLGERLTPTGLRIIVNHTGLRDVGPLNARQVVSLVNQATALMLCTPDFQYR